MYACPVEGNLSFQMLCQRTCTSCGAQSSRTEDFTSLSLDVLPHLSVEDLLKNYFKDSEVEFRCATCRGSHAVLSWTFITLPRVLVASHHDTTLEFAELLRATYSFVNVFRSGLHA
nr:ubiquitin carboxyl-terminal hydrolase 37-like [Paramormyrops kingsleyae]